MGNWEYRIHAAKIWLLSNILATDAGQLVLLPTCTLVNSYLINSYFSCPWSTRTLCLWSTRTF